MYSYRYEKRVKYYGHTNNTTSANEKKGNFIKYYMINV